MEFHEGTMVQTFLYLVLGANSDHRRHTIQPISNGSEVRHSLPPMPGEKVPRPAILFTMLNHEAQESVYFCPLAPKS
jgi:hypothetical protein